MSVATKNPFALLDAAEEGSAPSAPQSTTPAAAATPAASGRGSARGRGGPAARGGKYYPRGGGAPKSPTVGGEEAAGGERPKRTFDGEGRGRGRGGRGAARGARVDGGGRGGGGRLDRRSATGKTDSDKKVHQSWGGDDGNAELKAEEAATVDAAAESGGNDWGAEATAGEDAWAVPAAAASDEIAIPAPAEGEKREGRREREPEEEDNTLTLEQYLAQKAESEASALPKLETRKANDGADDTLWKDAIKMTKGEEEEAYFAGKAKSAPKARTEKKEKVFLEIEARFDRPDRGGGRGRGGRGGDRGDRGSRPGRGRGGPGRGRANGSPAINVDDEKAFPSLS